MKKGGCKEENELKPDSDWRWSLKKVYLIIKITKKKKRMNISFLIPFISNVSFILF